MPRYYEQEEIIEPGKHPRRSWKAYAGLVVGIAVVVVGIVLLAQFALGVFLLVLGASLINWFLMR